MIWLVSYLDDDETEAGLHPSYSETLLDRPYVFMICSFRSTDPYLRVVSNRLEASSER